MKIITGYKGEAHITSNEIQGENQGIFGTGSYVMNVGNKFSPTLISANELQISDGEGVIQGVHFRVDPGTYDSVTIENGAQGMNRKDLVICRYTKDAETGVEQTEWVVKKGTATSGTATRPSATSGNIRTGSTLAEMAMFEIVLSGINVTAVNPLFSVLKSMKELLDLENELNTKTNNDARFTRTASATHVFNVPNNSCNLFVASFGGGSRSFMAYVYKATGEMAIYDIAIGSNVTRVGSGNNLTITLDASNAAVVRVFNILGNAIS